MLNIGVLGSTNGSDLPAIVESINQGKLKGLAKIVVVVSDKEDSGILKKAKDYFIPYCFLNPKDMEREDYDMKVSKLLDEHNVGLIALIGYMRLFSEEFVKKYPNQIMNVHPSLLPYFPGMDLNVHKKVLDSGCKSSGCTIHFVDEGKDTGPIILQKEVYIKDDDTPETLKARVQKEEQKIYQIAIELYARGKLKVVGRKVIKIIK